MGVQTVIFKYFWVAAIFVTILNTIIFKYRSKQHIKDNPNLAEGYTKMIRGYLFWFSMPWVIMGIGCTFGGVPTMLHFFRPRDGNIFVIAWWLFFLIFWIISFHWIFFQKGANKLAQYKVIYYHTLEKTESISNPIYIRLVYLLFLVFGLSMIVLVFITDVPIPSFLLE